MALGVTSAQMCIRDRLNAVQQQVVLCGHFADDVYLFVCGCALKMTPRSTKMCIRDSYYGGLAITASGTTAVHALSYPLGGKYHIAHGVSNAILLAPVMPVSYTHLKPLLLLGKHEILFFQIFAVAVLRFFL